MPRAEPTERIRKLEENRALRDTDSCTSTRRKVNAPPLPHTISLCSLLVLLLTLPPSSASAQSAWPLAPFFGIWDIASTNTYPGCGSSDYGGLWFQVPVVNSQSILIEFLGGAGTLTLLATGHLEGGVSLIPNTAPNISLSGKISRELEIGRGTWFNNYGCGGMWIALKRPSRKEHR